MVNSITATRRDGHRQLVVNRFIRTPQGCPVVLVNNVYLSEHYNTLTSHRSPSSVADAIEHIAERIMVKAAEQATRVVDREANRTRK